MITAIIFLAIGSVLASGILFEQKRIFTLIGTAGAFWSAQWLLLTLIDRTIVPGGSNELFYLLGSFVLTVPWLFMTKSFSWPYKIPGSGRRDLVVLAVLVGVLLAAWLVQSKNGFNNSEWVTYGFYNGDTMTMMTLVERSLLTDGLVTQNPFAANGYLEYPTLWHAGLATLLSALGLENEWAYYLPALTYLQIILLVPMFFLLMDTFWPEPNRKEEKWLGVPSRLAVNILQAGIVFYVMANSWDNYIYPQSHFFLTGIFLLMVSLLVKVEKNADDRVVWRLLSTSVLGLVLMLSNAVTGAAAIATLIAFCCWKLLNGKEDMKIRLLYATGILLWVVVYLRWSAGDAIFGLPNFSYTSAESIMKLGPAMALLAIALLLAGGAESFVSLGVIFLIGMAIATFLLSQRNIVVANAERFVYHGLLVGFVLLVLPLIRAFYWTKQRLTLRTNTIRERGLMLGALFILLFIVGTPMLISGGRAHDNLMRKDKQVVDLGYREALEYVRKYSSVNEIFLADPNAPWALPMLTGRTMLRANYWLSPKDSVLDEVNAAFEGEETAQVSSLQRVDYLIIKHDELDKWNLNEHEEVFRGGKVSIFKTKS